jgi:ribosomal protein L16 Arg81 hydroxylase
MQYEREVMPLMRTVLRAGDMLYIPCGYWHRAQATDSTETAISIAVGINSLSALDVFDLLRNELKESLIWRQRLPIGGTDKGNGSIDNREHLKQMLELLSSDIARTMKCRSFLERVAKLVHGELRETDERTQAPKK